MTPFDALTHEPRDRAQSQEFSTGIVELVCATDPEDFA
jgi:hypothetical protein